MLLQTVEAASESAAAATFGVKQNCTTTTSKGHLNRAAADGAISDMHIHDAAYNEGNNMNLNCWRIEEITVCGQLSSSSTFSPFGVGTLCFHLQVLWYCASSPFTRSIFYWNGQLVCTPASTALFVCPGGTVSRLYRHIRQAAIPARVVSDASGIVDFCVTGREPASVIWTLAGECSAFCIHRECVFMLRGRYVL